MKLVTVTVSEIKVGDVIYAGERTEGSHEPRPYGYRVTKIYKLANNQRRIVTESSLGNFDEDGSQPIRILRGRK